jgi:uncharacterized protein YecE (DUF72 family)
VIYVGTCGFSYKDWVGPFYPPKTKAAEMLPYYARSFRAVEIDSSFYGVPQLATVETMAARTPAEFRFSFKIPQTVTHPADPSSLRVHTDASLLRERLEPIVAVGKLACTLAQFPNGFKPGEESEEYVRRVVETFEGVPVVVEFRNRLWQQRPETMDLLRALGAGYCNVDMPRLDGLLAPSSDSSGTVGYVRFHGRNAKMWWHGSNVTRYDYLYSPEELLPWADRIAEIEAQSSDTYVFFNNHANGQAPRNAATIASLLDERYGEAAPAVVAHAAGGNPEQRTLPGLPPRV